MVTNYYFHFLLYSLFKNENLYFSGIWQERVLRCSYFNPLILDWSWDSTCSTLQTTNVYQNAFTSQELQELRLTLYIRIDTHMRVHCIHMRCKGNCSSLQIQTILTAMPLYWWKHKILFFNSQRQQFLSRSLLNQLFKKKEKKKGIPRNERK